MSELYTIEKMAQAIEDDIAKYLKSEDEIRSVEPVGSLERTSNADAVRKADKACMQAVAKCPEPEITLEGGTLTISGACGEVEVSLREQDPIAQYVKRSGEGEEVPGSATAYTPKVWARLARWCVTGQKKFTDKSLT